MLTGEEETQRHKVSGIPAERKLQRKGVRVERREVRVERREVRRSRYAITQKISQKEPLRNNPNCIKEVKFVNKTGSCERANN